MERELKGAAAGQNQLSTVDGPSNELLSLRGREADRAHVEHHTAIRNPYSLDAMRLWIWQPNDVAHRQSPSGHMIDWHSPA